MFEMVQFLVLINVNYYKMHRPNNFKTELDIFEMLCQGTNIIGMDSYNILVLQALYGQRTIRPPDLCSSSSFDAIFEYPNGTIYVLKGNIIS
jgi:hypothetical protein